MASPAAIVTLGFLLGMRHATDPDHIAAMTTIVSRERSVRGAARLGALWGVGHMLTLLAVGIPILLFGVVIPEAVALLLEFAVALMLIALGTINVVGFFRHGQALTQASRPGLRSLIAGVVHGLAGSAALGLLVLATIRDPAWALLYLLLFGAGTLAGMALVTSTLMTPLAYAAARFRRIGPHVAWLSGAFSVALGAFLVYRVGFAEGLLTGDASWALLAR